MTPPHAQPGHPEQGTENTYRIQSGGQSQHKSPGRKNKYAFT